MEFFNLEKETKQYRKTYPSKQEVEVWKEEGAINLEVDGFNCWLSKPSIKTLSLAFTVGVGSNIDFYEVLVKHCWLAGDDVFLKDDDYFFAIGEHFRELTEIKEPTCQKQENGNYKIIVEDFECVIRKPTRQEMSQCEKRNIKNAPFKTDQFMLDLVWVSGDKETLMKNDSLYLSVLNGLREVRETKLIAIKKN